MLEIDARFLRTSYGSLFIITTRSRDIAETSKWYAHQRHDWIKKRKNPVILLELQGFRKSGRRDSNPRPLPPQGSALARLRYGPILLNMVFDWKSSTIPSAQSLAEKIPLAKVQLVKVHANKSAYLLRKRQKYFGNDKLETAGKSSGTLRRAVRNLAFAGTSGERHMECADSFDFCRLSQFNQNPVRNLATISLPTQPLVSASPVHDHR